VIRVYGDNFPKVRRKIDTLGFLDIFIKFVHLAGGIFTLTLNKATLVHNSFFCYPENITIPNPDKPKPTLFVICYWSMFQMLNVKNFSG